MPLAVPDMMVAPWQLPWEKHPPSPDRKAEVWHCPVGKCGKSRPRRCCFPRRLHGGGKGKCWRWCLRGVPSPTSSPSLSPSSSPSLSPCPSPSLSPSSSSIPSPSSSPVGVLSGDLVDADVEGVVGVAGDTSRLVDAKLGGCHRLARGHLGQVKSELLPVWLRGEDVPVLLDCGAKESERAMLGCGGPCCTTAHPEGLIKACSPPPSPTDPICP